MTRTLNEQDHTLIEEMIDRVGLAQVVAALGGICEAKAEHVQTNWQDTRLAQLWTRKAGQLSMLTERMTEEGDLP